MFFNIIIYSVPTLDQVDPNDRKGKTTVSYETKRKREINKIHKVCLYIDRFDILFYIAIYAARAQKIRDDWVKAMEARLIKEKLDECYRTEGVNHCKYTCFFFSFIVI